MRVAECMYSISMTEIHNARTRENSLLYEEIRYAFSFGNNRSDYVVESLWQPEMSKVKGEMKYQKSNLEQISLENVSHVVDDV